MYNREGKRKKEWRRAKGRKERKKDCDLLHLYVFVVFGIPYFQRFKFVRVCSLVGRYFYNMYIVKQVWNCVFLFMSRTIIYILVYIILDFSITYRIASVLCQSECVCLHKTVNIVVFFVKSNENTYPKGRLLMQMYRVVPITKRGNCDVDYM